MTCIDKFTVHTNEEQASLLAQKLPDGSLWPAKYDSASTLRKLLIGLGLEMIRTEIALNKVYCETQLETTNELIDEWELEYGIPASCFNGFGSAVEERIEAIRLNISTFGTSTKEQFEAIATALGLVITIIPGIEKAVFPFTFPMYFFQNLKWARFTMVVDMTQTLTGGFPYEFPFMFPDSNVAVMKCLFELLKPGNVQVIYINEG